MSLESISNKKPHIVIICISLAGSGSVARVARNQIRELSIYYNLSVISDSIPETKIQDVTYFKVDSRNYNYLRRFCHVPNELSFILKVRAQLLRIHNTTPIHFILCHSHTVASIAAKQLAIKNAVAFGIVTHGDIFDRPEGTYDKLLTRFYQWATPLAYQHASLIIALSPYMQEHIAKSIDDTNKLKIIPNGIDSPPLLMGKENTGNNSGTSLSLLYVGRISVEKGLEVLICACSELVESGVNFNLTIIGDGPRMADCRKLVNVQNLEENISFIGNIPREEIYEYYRQAQIFCIPSINDPLPTVVLEAMSVGTPVIGSDTGGISYMIENEITGLLFKPGDSSALAASISTLSKDPEKRKEMSKKARLKIKSEFSWKSICEQIKDEIDQCL